jgi:hypothetical protein
MSIGGTSMHFDLPPELVAKLKWDENGMFVLDPGMGPTMLLGRDGYVYYDGDGWDNLGSPAAPPPPIRRATPNESISSLVVGAEKQKVPELLDLLPPCPDPKLVCRDCAGTRRVHYGNFSMICPLCWGRGWLEPELNDPRP